MTDDFSHKQVRFLGREVHRLGLAVNYGIDSAGIEEALDSGIDWLFMPQSPRVPTAAVKAALARDRERVVLAAGPMLGWTGGNLRRFTERTLRRLGTEYIDVLHLFWLGLSSAWTPGTVDQLVELRDSGKVKAIGISIHDRERAGKLAADSPLDVLMIRYNAAHPGAEEDIFPHLRPDGPGIVAYTATRWRKLLKRPRGWTGRVPDAGDCYRFCLTNPHVDVVLTGPGDREQLRDNLAALDRGPMDAAELAWMREFGAVVHG